MSRHTSGEQRCGHSALHNRVSAQSSRSRSAMCSRARVVNSVASGIFLHVMASVAAAFRASVIAEPGGRANGGSARQPGHAICISSISHPHRGHVFIFVCWRNELHTCDSARSIWRTQSNSSRGVSGATGGTTTFSSNFSFLHSFHFHGASVRMIASHHSSLVAYAATPASRQSPS